MRQAGILAAAGSWALAHHVERLKEDHDNARCFADRVASIKGITLLNDEIESNLIFFDIAGTGLSAKEVSHRLLEQGVWIGVTAETRMRAVTHLDVDRQGVEEAGDLLAGIFAS
jgi:threonine aldolase